MMKNAAHLILTFGLAFGLPAAALAQAAPVAAKVDWTKTVVATPDGGFAMGNPKAPLTVTEYGSYTCHVCKQFKEEGVPKLMPYIASGKVRFEFRSYLRNSLDIVVSMVTYCQPPSRFFRMSDMMFTRTDEWSKGFSSISPDAQKAWEGKPLASILPDVSAKGGFTAFMQARGLPIATTNACLTNQTNLNKLQAAQKVAYEKYTIQGTPTFLLNGKKLDGVSGWSALEPRIKAGK
jgi:protein-disulfide isomerase